MPRGMRLLFGFKVMIGIDSCGFDREPHGYRPSVLNFNEIILPWTQLQQPNYAYQPMATDKIREVRAPTRNLGLDTHLTRWFIRNWLLSVRRLIRPSSALN